MEKNFEVIVIGAGHAGCEAALIAARRGAKTLLITGNLNTIAQMSCNPAIGGQAKGQIVREIDALGGEMAINTDLTAIQFRMLNASKGPAVQSPRAQCDKKAYQFRMKKVLERTQNLSVLQAEVTKILIKNQTAYGVETNIGATIFAKTIIITAGTFLNGLLHIGNNKIPGGRLGDFSSQLLSQSLIDAGIEIQRMKTGTPARILGATIDFSQCEEQIGDILPQKFAFYDTRENITCNDKNIHQKTDSQFTDAQNFTHENINSNNNYYNENNEKSTYFYDFSDNKIDPKIYSTDQIDSSLHNEIPNDFTSRSENDTCENRSCWITYTTEETKKVINENIHQSPLYSGEITGIGPRYCPSIEDKYVKFPDKDVHRLFLEPEGNDTDEWYINGLSTSLPFDVQEEILRTIPALKNAHIMRPAYAVEYDFAPPTQLLPTLESKVVANLFFAGQVNGTSGYEEAAGQGIVAGINAVNKIKNLEPMVLNRHDAYIGVLIDDLVTKGTDEPYRMFTSRAEYRLVLNHESAELRLLKYAKKYGLLSEERIAKIEKKQERIQYWIERFANEKYNHGTYDAAIVRQDENIEYPAEFLRELYSVQQEVIYRIAYRGYLAREMKQIEKMKDLDVIKIPAGFDFDNVKSLRIETRQKLAKILPQTLGQMYRISGISPADVNLVWVAIEAGR